MKKCPRCHTTLEDDTKYCPFCGLDLEQKYRPIQKSTKNKIMTFLTVGAIFFVVFVAPLLYSLTLDDIASMSGIGQLFGENKTQELPDVKDYAPQSILSQYETLADFKKDYKNVSTMITEIETYENEIEEKAKQTFNKEYAIKVLDNYNVLFQLRYTVQIDDNHELSIVRDYDRKHLNDIEKIELKKTNQKEFESLLLTNEEIEYINLFVNNEKELKKIVSDFSSRKTEFELKKEKLGHYGIGEYQDDLSFVVERYDDTYESILSYTRDMSKQGKGN
ncbi:MAG: zinc ribbon domain-containing protein [Erysipelotrichales bacterium]|nr:zinc ribbon domain-containing protein [Erysipelotrichales bacterium]